MTAIMPERTSNDEPEGIDHDRFTRGEVRTPGGYVYRDAADLADAMQRFADVDEDGVSPTDTVEPLRYRIPGTGGFKPVLPRSSFDTDANRRFLELAERNEIQPESTSMDRDGNFVGMTRAQWAAAATCPEWCKANHINDHDIDKREHAGESGGFALSIDDACNGEWDDTPLCAQLLTNQHRFEPFMQVDFDTPRKWVDMTLDEAQEFAEWMLDQVRRARKSMRNTDADKLT